MMSISVGRIPTQCHPVQLTRTIGRRLVCSRYRNSCHYCAIGQSSLLRSGSRLFGFTARSLSGRRDGLIPADLARWASLSLRSISFFSSTVVPPSHSNEISVAFANRLRQTHPQSHQHPVSISRISVRDIRSKMGRGHGSITVLWCLLLKSLNCVEFRNVRLLSTLSINVHIH